MHHAILEKEEKSNSCTQMIIYQEEWRKPTWLNKKKCRFENQIKPGSHTELNQEQIHHQAANDG